MRCRTGSQWSDPNSFHPPSYFYCLPSSKLDLHLNLCLLSLVSLPSGLEYLLNTSRPGLLKLWVATHMWVPEPSLVGRENSSSKNIITVIVSVSLPTNITPPLFY